MAMHAQNSGEKLELDYQQQRVESGSVMARIDTTIIPNKPVKSGKVTSVRFYTPEEYAKVSGIRNPTDEYFDTIYYIYEDRVVQPLSIPVQHAGSAVLPQSRPSTPRRELLSVKSNVLFDFAYVPAGYNRFCPIPNIAVEYYPLHGHFTFGA